MAELSIGKIIKFKCTAVNPNAICLAEIIGIRNTGNCNIRPIKSNCNSRTKFCIYIKTGGI